MARGTHLAPVASPASRRRGGCGSSSGCPDGLGVCTSHAAGGGAYERVRRVHRLAPLVCLRATPSFRRGLLGSSSGLGFRLWLGGCEAAEKPLACCSPGTRAAVCIRVSMAAQGHPTHTQRRESSLQRRTRRTPTHLRQTSIAHTSQTTVLVSVSFLWHPSALQRFFFLRSARRSGWHSVVWCRRNWRRCTIR